MFSLPSQPKIIEKKDNFAVFEISGLYPGYGITIGNSFRRVLLSSLPGAAITQVKIKGAQHEFSTIPGVKEDVISILLNLKQLRFKLHSDEPQKAELKVKGIKDAKANLFNLPSQVELSNKDLHIASLTAKSAELNIEVVIENGLGYETVESRKKEKLDIGTMAVDAVFTPVRKVSYRVENMRVGDRTDFDKLFLELETDGTITPEEAFAKSAETLINHFSLFKETFDKIEKPEKPAQKTVAKKNAKKKKRKKTK